MSKISAKFIDFSAELREMSVSNGDSFLSMNAETGKVMMSQDMREAFLEALGFLETFTELQYVRSNHSFVITDVTLDGNYKITFKGRSSPSGTILAPYTAHSSSTFRQGLVLFNTNSHKIAPYWPNVAWADLAVPDYINFNAAFTIEQDRYGITISQGENVWDSPYDGSGESGDVPLYIFGSANANHTDYRNGEFEELLIERDGEVIAHFIPRMRNMDNVAGIYDTVSSKFYVSNGSPFIAGPVAE